MVKGILVIGFLTFVMQITSSIQHLILNRSLAHHGGDLALAAIGIIMSISTLLVMPAMGIFFKFLPLIGVQLMSASYFQAVGKPHQATILSLSRQVFIFIPLLVMG